MSEEGWEEFLDKLYSGVDKKLYGKEEGRDDGDDDSDSAYKEEQNSTKSSDIYECEKLPIPLCSHATPAEKRNANDGSVTDRQVVQKSTHPQEPQRAVDSSSIFRMAVADPNSPCLQNSCRTERNAVAEAAETTDSAATICSTDDQYHANNPHNRKASMQHDGDIASQRSSDYTPPPGKKRDFKRWLKLGGVDINNKNSKEYNEAVAQWIAKERLDDDIKLAEKRTNKEKIKEFDRMVHERDNAIRNAEEGRLTKAVAIRKVRESDNKAIQKLTDIIKELTGALEYLGLSSSLANELATGSIKLDSIKAAYKPFQDE